MITLTGYADQHGTPRVVISDPELALVGAALLWYIQTGGAFPVDARAALDKIIMIRDTELGIDNG